MNSPVTHNLPQCEFLIAFKQVCWAVTTHRRRTIVKTILNGQLHEWSPPEEFYCERHAVMAAQWGGEICPVSAR